MTYIECSCLPQTLREVLDKAISNLEKESVGTKSEDYEKIKRDVEKHLDELRNMGIPDNQIETMKQSLPRDPVLKKFDDLKQWVQECTCPEDKEFDWTKFPYHEIGYREPSIRTERTGEVCNIPLAEQISMKARIKELANKYIYSLDDPVFLVFMKDKYGEKDISGSNVRREVVKKGYMTQNESDELIRLSKELDDACGRHGKGTTLREFDTMLLKERKETHGLLTRPKSEFGFGKK